MNWTIPYPWRLRSESVRRINMSSEPGSESFFSALRPIPRILSLRRRDDRVKSHIGGPSRRKAISACSRAGCESRCGTALLDDLPVDQNHSRILTQTVEDNLFPVG